MNYTDTLMETIKRLRAPDGCPWDREQSHKSVRGHLVEECAELLEAIDLDDADKMKEELGDVLLHLMLHAEIASEEGKFNFADVERDLNAKIVRRHPHVFGEANAKDTSDVLKIWQDVKAREKKERAVGGLFDGIPPQLSAMRYAWDVAKKADKELLREASNRAKNEESKHLKFGKAMFELILEAVGEKIEPESALRDYISLIREIDKARSSKK